MFLIGGCSTTTLLNLVVALCSRTVLSFTSLYPHNWPFLLLSEGDGGDGGESTDGRTGMNDTILELNGLLLLLPHLVRISDGF